MQRCYDGESFELRFDIRDCKDEERAVTSATMDDIGPDGTVLSSGVMSIDADGHTATIRYTASNPGMHRLVVRWRMDDDAWVQPFLMMIEDATQ